jgi:hypothetical protein
MLPGQGTAPHTATRGATGIVGLGMPLYTIMLLALDNAFVVACFAYEGAVAVA